jgi:diaminohydroxyphosphoribosylaminopyrimidine deaminase/5-amino-6-(5-phosphoribosylamino)uracil reductase
MRNFDPTLRAAMQHALAEARRYLGATSPNPPVGAVALTARNEILWAAAHQKAGLEHAEAALLRACRQQNLLKNVHSIAVTLEPCNHTGRTPPCTEAIIESGIRRVIVGAKDPNPSVKGGGCDRLRTAGIEVIEGIEAESCHALMHAFAHFTTTGKPFVTVKRAFDDSGSMIPPKGQKTFTSPESLILAHRLRKKADAIVTGAGTILADDPSFTIRHVPDHTDKRRMLAILDRSQRIPVHYVEEATSRGFDVKLFDDIDCCFAELAALNIQDVLVEAGPLLSSAILASPHWTMRVDIHKGEPDRVEVSFNKPAPLPFSPLEVDLEDLLPQ